MNNFVKIFQIIIVIVCFNMLGGYGIPDPIMNTPDGANDTANSYNLRPIIGFRLCMSLSGNGDF